MPPRGTRPGRERRRRVLDFNYPDESAGRVPEGTAWVGRRPAPWLRAMTREAIERAWDRWNPYGPYNPGSYTNLPAEGLGVNLPALPYRGGFGGAGGGAAALPFFRFPELPSAPGPLLPPEPVTWEEKYNAEGAPPWWRGLVPSRFSPEAEYATLINALIPSLSTEDQRTAAQELSRLFPEAFGGYSPEVQEFQPPGQITTGMRDRFTSAMRAYDTLNRLTQAAKAAGRTPGEEKAWRERMDKMAEDYRQQVSAVEPERDRLRRRARKASMEIDDPNERAAWLQAQEQNIEQYIASKYSILKASYEKGLAEAQQAPGAWGPGYQFLRQVLDVLQDFGGAGARQSRRQYQQMLGALDPLLAEARGEALSAYGPIAQALAQPFFSAGEMVPVRRLPNGRWMFGRPNPAIGF